MASGTGVELGNVEVGRQVQARRIPGLLRRCAYVRVRRCMEKSRGKAVWGRCWCPPSSVVEKSP